MSTSPEPGSPEAATATEPGGPGPSVAVPVAFIAALFVWGLAMASANDSGASLLLGMAFGISSPLLVLGLLAGAIVVAAKWRRGVYQPAASRAGLVAWLLALLLYAGAIVVLIVG